MPPKRPNNARPRPLRMDNKLHSQHDCCLVFEQTRHRDMHTKKTNKQIKHEFPLLGTKIHTTRGIVREHQQQHLAVFGLPINLNQTNNTHTRHGVSRQQTDTPHPTKPRTGFQKIRKTCGTLISPSQTLSREALLLVAFFFLCSISLSSAIPRRM